MSVHSGQAPSSSPSRGITSTKRSVFSERDYWHFPSEKLSVPFVIKASQQESFLQITMAQKYINSVKVTEVQKISWSQWVCTEVCLLTSRFRMLVISRCGGDVQSKWWNLKKQRLQKRVFKVLIYCSSTNSKKSESHTRTGSRFSYKAIEAKDLMDWQEVYVISMPT